jgi:hypothetical protein
MTGSGQTVEVFPGTEPFSPCLCGMNLQRVDGLGELSGTPGEATELTQDVPGLELHPDEPPVRDVLAEWAGHANGDDRPALLRALNEAVGEEDRDFKIGPAYLMRDDAATLEGPNEYGSMICCCRCWRSTTTAGSAGHRCASGSGCRPCGPARPAAASAPPRTSAHDRDTPD